jgi:hypothetical protein
MLENHLQTGLLTSYFSLHTLLHTLLCDFIHARYWRHYC